jgi:hypothetical protein
MYGMAGASIHDDNDDSNQFSFSSAPWIAASTDDLDRGFHPMTGTNAGITSKFVCRHI